MKKLLGVCLILLGLVLGVWLGIRVMFIGGIVQIVNAIKATPVSAIGIAIGIVKVLFSGVVGWLSGLLISGVGALLLD